MTNLCGEWMRKLSRLGEHGIKWRNTNGADSSRVELLRYDIYKYQIEGSGEILPVFVQEGLNIDDYRQVTNQFQFGDWSGKVFLVLHDKEGFQLPQQSFLCADVADLILPDNEEVGGFGFGVGTFGFMDRLKDFDCVP